jgi:gamma-glutamyl-gamma-aminobutyrate hydrolase PuuD
MKLGLISQKIYNDKYNQINFALENNWINFFKKKKIKLIPIFSNELDLNYYFKFLNVDFLIITGGSNNIYSNSKENILRQKIEKKLISLAIKKKIPILAVCYGFQLVAKINSGKIYKSKHKPDTNHNICVDNKNINVNSYHNYSVLKLSDDFKIIGKHKDNSIEIAYSKKKKLLCTMFHPERKNKSQQFINKLIFKFLNI